MSPGKPNVLRMLSLRTSILLFVLILPATVWAGDPALNPVAVYARSITAVLSAAIILCLGSFWLRRQLSRAEPRFIT